jgi:hypothetical protein
VLGWARFACALAATLVLARDANAVGGILSTARDPVTVVEVRYAVAVSPARTTRWASLRLDHFPGAMAWLLPVRPGARADEVTDAWFEALELATSPRVVGSGCDADASAPLVRIERSTVHEPSARALHMAGLDDVGALRAFAAEWGLDLLPEIEMRCEALEARGFGFLAVVHGGAADRTITRTVRVTDDSFPAMPLFLTSAPASNAIRVAAFLIGETRARVGKAAETEIQPGVVSFSDGGSSSYDNVLLDELLSQQGASWVVEAADHAFFFDGVLGPSGSGKTPPMVAAYLERAAAYGDPSDDLTLAISGLDASRAWITRVAGIVPAGEFGDDLAVTMSGGEPKSPFIVAGHPAGACIGPSPDGGSVVAGGGMTSSGGDAGLREGGVSSPPGPAFAEAGPSIGAGTGGGSETTGGAAVVRGGVPAPATQVGTEGSISCSCSPGADDSGSGDSCDRSESPAGDFAASSGDTSSSDGCDGSSGDSSDDEGGCDSSSNDGSDSGGCDGGSPDDTSDGGGCDSTGSSSDGKCAVSRRTRRGRSHTSAVVLALVAIVLPLRRLTRPRRPRAREPRWYAGLGGSARHSRVRFRRA